MNLRVFLFNKTGDFGWLQHRRANTPYNSTPTYNNGGRVSMSAFENNTTPACSSAITLLGHAN